MKNISILVLLAGLVGFGSVSCEPEYDTPPIPSIPEGKLITIDTLWNWYAASGSQSITEDYSLYAVVTTDETSGNFYKEAYIQDGKRGIRLRFSSSSSLSIGDSVRVYLKGCYLDNYNSLIQLDSVDPDKNIIIQKNNVDITPKVLTISDLSSMETIDSTSFYTYQSMFIELDDVEFAGGGTWADAINNYSVNHDLDDCFGSTVLVRTSGYSNFAGDVVPSGNGMFLGVMGVYGVDVQMYVRTPDELDMNGYRCGTIPCNPNSSLSEDFSLHSVGASVSNYCWSTYSTPGGAANWTIASLTGNNVASSSLQGTSVTGSQEMWMISPEVAYASSNSLSFQTAVENWTHDGLEVYILTNYSGNPTTATQHLVSTATLAGSGTGNNVFVNSGSISISGLGVSSNYYIGFKYTGNPTGGQTGAFKVDNVILTQ